MTKNELKNQIIEDFADKYQPFWFAEDGAQISQREFSNLKGFIRNVIDDAWEESKIAERKRIRQAVKARKERTNIPSMSFTDILRVIGRKPENRDVDIEQVSVKEIFNDDIEKLGKHDGGQQIKWKVNELIDVINQMNHEQE